MSATVGFKNERIATGIIYACLLLITITTLLPFINIIAVSLSDSAQLDQTKGMILWPQGFSLLNYTILFKNSKVIKGLGNSTYITLVGTILNIIFTTMMAYALSRPKLPGKRFIMLFVLITMVFEPGIVPEYLLIKALGLYDTYRSVILYKLVNAYYLIILMRFFEEIPQALLDAAKIDGASEWQTLWKVVLPLSKPIIASIGLFYGVYHWNEYFRALIYLNSPVKWPLQVVLREFVVSGDKQLMVGLKDMFEYTSIGQVSLQSLKAGIIIITSLPVLAVYPLLLKYFTKGTMSGGVKE